MTFSKGKELRLHPRINYPVKLSISFQERKWIFKEIGNFQTSLMKRLQLNGQFYLHIQAPREA